MIHLIYKINELVKRPKKDVKASIYGSEIILPGDHSLPNISKKYTHYSQNLKRLFTSVLKKYNQLSFIDIGANIGDSIVLVNSVSSIPILAVEGDEKFFKYLKLNTNNLKNVTLSKTYLGDIDKNVSVKVDSSSGTLNLIKGKSKTKINVKRLDNLLQLYPQFSGSKLIKIDTDGYDLKIIKGAVELIKSTKPVIFFEYDPYLLKTTKQIPLNIFNFFRKFKYEKILIYDNFGYFLIGLDLNEKEKLIDISNYFSGWKSNKYADVAVFHKEDADIYYKLREKELELKLLKK